MVGQNHSQAVPNFLLWELSQGNLGVLQQRNPGNAAGIGHSKAQRASRTTQPRHWAVPRKHITEGPQGAAGRGRARQRSSLLEGAAPSAPTFPARQRSLVIEIDWPIEREKVGRHGGHPSSFITNAARQRLSKTWRAMLRRRPLFPRASAALSDGWGRGCAPRESDDTEVVPPVLSRTRRGSAARFRQGIHRATCGRRRVLGFARFSAERDGGRFGKWLPVREAFRSCGPDGSRCCCCGWPGCCCCRGWRQCSCPHCCSSCRRGCDGWRFRPVHGRRPKVALQSIPAKAECACRVGIRGHSCGPLLGVCLGEAVLGNQAVQQGDALLKSLATSTIQLSVAHIEGAAEERHAICHSTDPLLLEFQAQARADKASMSPPSTGLQPRPSRISCPLQNARNSTLPKRF